ncbi:ABC transporter ATP-binding protein [uncultured Desulfovibrio sp.]|uniref:ABC transporter ATP-binding protein n=1 Tax=uncultured Desulfovibrio sp. TaxID=167968 RepID=UPI00262B7796|nr:ABC transporter ATP-binding protein [uncultured Desulfovibrio sp.]
MTTKKKSPNPLYMYWQATVPEKGKLLPTLGLACLAGLLEVVPYVLICFIAREALGDSPNKGVIIWLIVGIFCAVILRFMAQAGVTVLGHLAGFSAEWRLRTQLIERLALARPAAVEGKSAQLSRTVMDEVARLHDILAHTVPDIVSGLVLTVACAVFLLMVDWRLTLLALLMLFVGIWAQSRISRASPAYFERWVQAERRTAAALLFYVRGLATLRAFNRHASSLQEVRNSIFDLGKLGGDLTRVCSMPYSVFGLAMLTPLLAVLPAAFWFYSKGTLSVADMLLFIAVSGIMLLPLAKVAMSLPRLRNLQTGAAHIQEMMDISIFPEVSDAENSPKSAEIIFENVSYRMTPPTGNEVALLRNVSFRLAPGSVTTVTGPSGAGKTTLARLLARLDDVSEGRILIGGQDIRQLPPQQFQSLISIVFQNSFLFYGTIRENILLARPEATEEEVQQAAEAAGCTAMLKELPQGLDTRVGDKGLGLSGGEQQRIAIARAFLKNAPILILDEAMAHLDPIVAKEISQSLKRLMAGKTVFAISHRLRDIEHADETLVMAQGALEAKGTHEELIVNSQTYRKLWQIQEQSRVWRLGKKSLQEEQA